MLVVVIITIIIKIIVRSIIIIVIVIIVILMIIQCPHFNYNCICKYKKKIKIYFEISTLYHMVVNIIEFFLAPKKE